MIYFGFDPGGIASFGWAALHIDAAGKILQLSTGVATTAQDAINKAHKSVTSAPRAVGIDAPMYWVSEGDRRVDAAIRKRVVAAGGQSGTVNHVNSLRGACIVQGILTARLVGKLWPDTLITEAHPKALLRLYKAAGKFLEDNMQFPHQEHERDAALAAFSAWAAASGMSTWRNWVTDENEPFFPSGRLESYWFPEPAK